MVTSVAPVPPALGAVGSVRWLWRQLTSMRTALVLLLLLAVATIPGSLFPQRIVDQGAVVAYLADNPESGKWLDRLGLFDVYASPWFAAVYLLLFLSLLGCIVPRARAHVGEWRRRPPATPRRLDRLPGHGSVVVDAGVDVVADRLVQALRRRGPGRGHGRDLRGGPWLGHTVDRHDEGGGSRSLAAETGRLRETGNLLFHVSLIGVLLALATGSLYAYRGEAIVVEGASFSNVVPAYDSITPGARFDASALPPFMFRLDGLEVAFEETQAGEIGSPRDFAADVSYREDLDDDPRQATVRVNQPLEVAGTHVFLTGNGYAPAIEVRDRDGVVRTSGPVPFLPQDATYTSTGVVKALVPGGDDIGLTGFFLPTAAADAAGDQVSLFPDARIPRLVLTAWTGDVGLGAAPQSVYDLDTTDMTQVAGTDGEPFLVVLEPGQSVDLPDGLGRVTFTGLPRFAAFQVRADPSGPLALVAAVLAILGLTVSLFLPRRRVWVRLTPDPDPHPDGPTGGRTVVQVGVLSRSRDAGVAAEVDRVLAVALGTGERDVPAARTRSTTKGPEMSEAR